MILKKSNQNIKALAVCIGFFSLAACREHSITGKDVIPEVDNINTFAKSTADFEYSFKNLLSDSIITSSFNYNSASIGSTGLNALIIGGYKDPFFGETQSIAHFQVTPYSSQFKFPENAVLDSAVFVLPMLSDTYTGFQYGDTTNVTHWSIYKTGEKLDKNTTYYSSQSTGLGDLIGTAAFKFQDYSINSQQIIAATNDTTTGQLRIKLNQSFATEMFNADSSNYKSTSAFFEFFNGISIVPDMSATQNTLSYFLLPTPSTSDQKNLGAARIEFHYHTPDTVVFSSLVMRPTVCGYYSNIQNNKVGYPVNQMLNRNSDSILIQSQPGLSTDITIKGLASIPKSVINLAELTFTVQKAGNTLDYLTPLDVVVPVIVNENGREEPLFERLDNNGANNNAGITMVNPFSKLVTINGSEYSQFKLNIPRTLQQFITEGKDSFTIRLKGPNYYPGMFRILAKGSENINDETGFKFNVIYTKK